jgi:NMD protein affecting ribosome stability and mRNA decay
MRHCPLCNKSSDESRFYGEFCEDCAGRKMKEALPHEADLVTCKDCAKIKVSGVFTKLGNSSIERLLQSEMKKYKINLLHFGNGIARITAVSEKQEGLMVETNVHLKKVTMLCDRCSRIRAGYYEAILQLRGEESKVQRMSETLDRYLERNGAFVTKIEQKDHGVDVYTSDKKSAFAFISSRRLKFKASFELYGMKNGRRVYRNTYFITM